MFRSTLFALLGGSFLWPAIEALNTPFLVQSFYFNYNLPSEPVPVPVTAQCDTIHITWERGVATGPNPTAPYFLQIYTSTFIFPFIVAAGSGLSFDWTVPFAPGTQYQICMFDKNGYTGGCQAMYTVIAPPKSSSASCPNVTFPAGPLDIEAVVDNGPLSQYGWVDQCTDISVTPKNGTPPYIFTVAPALHPPYNISSNDMTNMNWTVSLSWASPFFISVVDSVGNFWSNGPLHSGGNGPTACLAGDVVKPTPKMSPGIPVGAGVSGLVVGALAGIAATCIIIQRRGRGEGRGRFMDLIAGSPEGNSPTAATFDQPAPISTSYYHPVPSLPVLGHLDTSLGSSNPSSANSLMLSQMTRGSVQYQIEPFVAPTEDGRISRPSEMHPGHGGRSALPSVAHEPQIIGPQNQVYVVHHDGGRAPVSVYHQDGTEVVELPPRYIGSEHRTREVRADGRSEVLSSGSEGRSDGRSDAGRTDMTDEPPFLRQQRKPRHSGKPQTPTDTPA